MCQASSNFDSTEKSFPTPFAKRGHQKAITINTREQGTNFTLQQHSCPIYSVTAGSVTLGLPYLGEACFTYTVGLQIQGHLIITHKGKDATVPRMHLSSARRMNYDTLSNAIIRLKFRHILWANPEPAFE